MNAQVRVERLYLKDASFESPRSPEVFSQQWQPQMQLDINSQANGVGDNLFEVVLTVTLRAKQDGAKTAFIIEVQQAGIFRIEGAAAELRQQVLGTICPSTLFPYVRETVDSLAVRGGFPAVHLAPVKFEALYAEALARQQGGGDADEAGTQLDPRPDPDAQTH